MVDYVFRPGQMVGLLLFRILYFFLVLSRGVNFEVSCGPFSFLLKLTQVRSSDQKGVGIPHACLSFS